MDIPRLPRFERVPTVPPIELTERDCQIIRLVNRHRFLHSSHITSLVDGNAQQIVRRLQLLYHHGFLERPRCQLDYYHRGGSRRIVYGIGSKGAALLSRDYGIPMGKIRWGEKNRSVGRVHLEHELFVSDVMLAIESACRRRGIRLLLEEELSLQKSGKRLSFRWRVSLNAKVKLGVVPDRVFGLEYPNRDGVLERAFFFLEADRGTMPVVRRNLSHTSFYRKLLAYQATWSQSIHQARFGFHRFRVLTVTQSSFRVDSLVKACSQLKGGRGLFLFADNTILSRPQRDIFVHTFRDGYGENASLIDQVIFEGVAAPVYPL